VKYTQVLPTDPKHAEFDGIAELYFEDLADLHAALGSAGARDYDPDRWTAARAREDVDNFLAIEDRPRFVGEETVRKEYDGDTDGLYKHAAFLVRKSGLTHEEFVDYSLTEHVPLARDIEAVVRYVTVLPTDPRRAEFDGVAELYFEDLADLHAALGSAGARDYDPGRGTAARARDDVDNFLAVERRPRFIGRERVVKDET
jgi:hypothetical protein